MVEEGEQGEVWYQPEWYSDGCLGAGFIGGTKTLEGVIKMAQAGLTLP